MNPILKLVLEMGPLAVFFVGNYKFGIFPATAAFMVAMMVSLAVSYTVSRKLPVMPLVTCAFVLIFGGLKLLLEDLRQGRPATVFASLVLYGCALIVAPRLTRKLRNPSPRPATATK